MCIRAILLHMERLEQMEFSEQTEQVERLGQVVRTEHGTERNKVFAVEKGKNMNAKQINQKYQIIDFLLLRGFKESYVKGGSYWYKSMIRTEESTPSFKVDTKLNLWYDHGIGIGGNLIDLACHLFKSDDIRQIIRELLETFSSFQPQNKVIIKAENIGIQLLNTEKLTDETLLHYLQNRGIKKEIGEKYCQQLDYVNAGKHYKNIGFKNTSGGYELRGESFKSCIAPKDISFIDNGKSKLSVFEGFIDFLSYLTLPEFEIQDCNYLILNSLSFIGQIDNILNNHIRIYLFLDNDTAGLNTADKLKRKSPFIIDVAVFYRNNKDLNDYLSSKIKNNEI